MRGDHAPYGIDTYGAVRRAGFSPPYRAIARRVRGPHAPSPFYFAQRPSGGSDECREGDEIPQTARRAARPKGKPLAGFSQSMAGLRESYDSVKLGL